MTYRSDKRAAELMRTTKFPNASKYTDTCSPQDGDCGGWSARGDNLSPQEYSPAKFIPDPGFTLVITLTSSPLGPFQNWSF